MRDGAKVVEGIIFMYGVVWKSFWFTPEKGILEPS